MRPDPHAPLREDVRLLGDLLGETLRRHGPPGLFEEVERLRLKAKAARRDGDRGALRDALAALDADGALACARAFSLFLTLANIAEQHHRVRRRRAYQIEDSAPQRASFDEAFPRLLESGVSRERLREAVGALSVELVLTAHPTEVVRRTLLQNHQRIGRLLGRRARPDLTPRERAATREALRREIESVWCIDEIHRTRPTPVEEARGGLLVFEQTLWDAAPAYLRDLDEALRRHAGAGLPLGAAPIRFGSWMGGDRDGNPNVTPAVTREVCAMARWIAADLYWREVDALRAELAMARGSRELHEVVGAVPEPYRALLRGVRDRLDATRAIAAAEMAGEPPPEVEGYAAAEALRAPLMLCWRSLHETGAAVIAPAGGGVAPRGPPAGSAAPAGHLRAHPRAPGHPPGGRPPHRGPRRGDARAGAGVLRPVG